MRLWRRRPPPRRQVALRLTAVLLAVAAAGSAAVRLAAQTDLSSGQAAAAASPTPTGAVAPGAPPPVSRGTAAVAASGPARVPAAPSGTDGGTQAPAAVAASKPLVPPSKGAIAAAPGTNRLGTPAARSAHSGQAHRRSGALYTLWCWLWSMGAGADGLAQATVAMIALLAAFLTVVQTWQIPPPVTPLANPQSAPAAVGKATAPAGNTPPKSSAAADKPLGPFDSNFARTVFTGLGGMFAVGFLDSVWSTGQPGKEGWNRGFDSKSYYLVLFVVFFLAILFLFALLRGAGEALRSRVVLVYKPPVWQPFNPRNGHPRAGNGQAPAAYHRLGHWLAYWVERPWRWLLSWRSSLLVFWDTAFNVIQGKNQLETVEFQRSIIELQTSLMRATSQVCQEVHAVVFDALSNHSEAIDYWDIRVNVSALSDDEKSLFYIALETGSLSRSFPRASLAWVAVASGTAKWYKDLEGYRNAPLATDRATLDLLDIEKPLVRNYYQHRGPEDYKGFIVFPIPWGRRGEGSLYRRAGLHISFREHSYMNHLWTNLDSPPPPPPHHGALTSRASEGGTHEAKAPEAKAHEVKAHAGKADGCRVTDDKDIPNYEGWTGLLSRLRRAENPPADGKNAHEIVPQCPVVRAVLQQSVDVLAELLRHFNQQVFEDYIRPTIGE